MHNNIIGKKAHDFFTLSLYIIICLNFLHSFNFEYVIFIYRYSFINYDTIELYYLFKSHENVLTRTYPHKIT